MPKRLSEDQIAQFGRDGFTSPVDVFSAAEIARYRAGLEQFEAAQGHPLDGSQRAKGYVLFDWQYDMLTHPNVLDAIEDLIGANILLFHCTAWLKEPDGAGFVSWHQDSTYFGLEPAVQVTSWMALSASTPESACIRVLPGSHTDGQLPWYNGETKNNLLSSGQNVKLEVDEAKTVFMPLAAGQMSLHHTHAVHGSNPNMSEHRRLGFGVSYIPTDASQTGDSHSGAILVRGVDDHGNFPAETPAAGNADPASVAAHADALRMFRENSREKGNLTVDRLG